MMCDESQRPRWWLQPIELLWIVQNTYRQSADLSARRRTVSNQSDRAARGALYRFDLL